MRRPKQDIATKETAARSDPTRIVHWTLVRDVLHGGCLEALDDGNQLFSVNAA
jgi:hypothetical protein